MYQVLASDQHDLEEKLLPERGRILIRDNTDGKLYPLAANRDAWNVYAEPKNLVDPVAAAHELSAILEIPDVDLIEKIANKPDDPYELIARDISLEQKDRIMEKNLKGVKFARNIGRLYPEKNMGGQVVGLVTPNDQGVLVGRYGIESSYEEILAGVPGALEAEKDAAGRRLIFTQSKLKEAIDGSDIVLTLDRSIQFQACEHVRNGVLNFGADKGTIIVMDVKTGAILGMCSYPDFDPGNLKEIEDVAVFNNPAVFESYEPGSVFKALTMAAGIEENKVGPNTTYEDKGSLQIDDHTIKNSDGKVHGVKTMIEVLELSLNTGSIFVQQQLGKKLFQQYVKAFGFGEKTGIELSPEAKGNISSLDKPGDVFAATASYGQGIAVSPLQMLVAFGALANEGKLMRPYIVSEIIHNDGNREVTQPLVRNQIIGQKTAQLIGRMLTSVVEGPHGKGARVEGYWVAGKTGTAQVARNDGLGYEDGNVIASFIGYAPADDPKFAMLVKFNHPRNAEWGSTTAAPVFGDMAKYLLNYFGIKPTRN